MEEGMNYNWTQEYLVKEPLWYLLATPDYYTTDWWKMRTRQFKEDHGLICDGCSLEMIDVVGQVKKATKQDIEEGNYSGWTEDDWGNNVGHYHYREVDRIPKFITHHVTYERKGNERDEDLRLLCSMCHNLLHYLQYGRTWQGTSGMAAKEWLLQRPELETTLPLIFPVDLAVGEPSEIPTQSLT
jgi:hypothetical protein